MNCYFDSKEKSDCFGCEACSNVCPKNAIAMRSDDELFRYPKIDEELCINCGKCKKACIATQGNVFEASSGQRFLGGFAKDKKLRLSSSSGGAFSLIADIFCDKDYVIFGVEYDSVYGAKHSFITDKKDISKFRGSKYSQSVVGDAFKNAKKFLHEGKKVLFSGTPCQIGGLKSFLGKEYDNLLTVDVICESVPSPLFMQKYLAHIEKKFKSKVASLKYRNKKPGRWKFYDLTIGLVNGKSFSQTRYKSLFYNTWFSGLMSRPGCSNCLYSNLKRPGDISLGDLWGIYKFPRKLYGGGSGTSIVISNTKLGNEICEALRPYMIMDCIDKNLTVSLQRPLESNTKPNPKRAEFIEDLKSLKYEDLEKKWSRKLSLKMSLFYYLMGGNIHRFIYFMKNKAFQSLRKKRS